MHQGTLKDYKDLIKPARTRTISCTSRGRTISQDESTQDIKIDPENTFCRVRRLTKEHIQANLENPITFHCCPPEGPLAKLLTLLFSTFSILLAAQAVFGEAASPGSNIFALLVLIILALLGGVVIRFVVLIVYKCCNIDLRLPSLLGMLLIGIMLKNIPYNFHELSQPACMGLNISFTNNSNVSLYENYSEDDDDVAVNCERRFIGKDLDPKMSSALRTVCLTVILLMAGLEIDPVALWNLSGMVLRATFIPCFVECLVVAVLSNLILGFPWTVGFMLGFILAAVSPAVIIPCMVSLSERGYGVEKGIPTLVIAASSADDVVAISGFGIFLGLTFNQDAPLLDLVLHGPMEVLMGTSFGVSWGLLAQWVPDKNHRNVTFFRWLNLFLGGLIALFGSHLLGYDGAGGLATIIMAFVAAMQWRKEGWGDHNPVSKVFTKMWILLEPLIFALIGTKIQVDKIDPETLGWGILVLVTALLVRMVGTFLAVGCGNLNVKERIFLAFAWMPKATVQAALGPIFLDRAKLLGRDELLHMGDQILTLAVLSILITAPLGAICIMALGPKLLDKQDEDEEEDDIEGIDQD